MTAERTDETTEATGETTGATAAEPGRGHWPTRNKAVASNPPGLQRAAVVERERAVGAGLAYQRLITCCRRSGSCSDTSCSSERSTSSCQVSAANWLQPLRVGLVVTAL
jgi:hypothetical protein